MSLNSRSRLLHIPSSICVFSRNVYAALNALVKAATYNFTFYININVILYNIMLGSLHKYYADTYRAWNVTAQNQCKCVWYEFCTKIRLFKWRAVEKLAVFIFSRSFALLWYSSGKRETIWSIVCWYMLNIQHKSPFKSFQFVIKMSM